MTNVYLAEDDDRYLASDIEAFYIALAMKKVEGEDILAEWKNFQRERVKAIVEVIQSRYCYFIHLSHLQHSEACQRWHASQTNQRQDTRERLRAEREKVYVFCYLL